ncbi:MAG: pilus assembly protein N-terminal domain-containing protein [Myxococcaceae bacterium]|nr:pilus assembly protein N-terminal domain-containing protein [Myxococcaceae bacterium]
MSDESPPPPLDPAVQAFLWSHAETGEPDERELSRVLLRLVAKEPTKVVRLLPTPPLTGRRFLAPEVMAVAAVLVVSVVGGLVAFSLRAPTVVSEPSPPPPAAPQPPPKTPDTTRLSVEMIVAEYAANGGPVPSDDPTVVPDLLLEAREALREQSPTTAIAALSRCLAIDPASVDCTVLLGSAFARRAAESGSELDNHRARALYERFLAIAPPDNKRVTRVRSILAGESAPPSPPASASMLAMARDAEQTSPEHARRLYRAVFEYAPDSESGRAARARLEALEAASPVLHSTRLSKITSSPIGAEIIIDGTPTGRRTPVLPRDALEVSPGLHQLEFEFDGVRSAPIVFDARPGGPDDVLRGEVPRRAAELPIELKRGGQRVVRIAGQLARVSVGSADIADVRVVGPSDVRIDGLARGETTLIIWDSEERRSTYSVIVR